MSANQLFEAKAKLFTKENNVKPGARFSKDPENFRAGKAIFSSSVSKNGAVHAPESFCMKETSVHVKNTWIKQLCNRKVQGFAMALPARKVSGSFEKRAPALWIAARLQVTLLYHSKVTFSLACVHGQATKYKFKMAYFKRPTVVRTPTGKRNAIRM